MIHVVCKNLWTKSKNNFQIKLQIRKIFNLPITDKPMPSILIFCRQKSLTIESYCHRKISNAVGYVVQVEKFLDI